MSGLDREEIQKAYNRVRDDKDPLNWFILSYETTDRDTLLLSSSGEGGLAEMVAKFKDDEAQYGYVRVEYQNDSESRRIKFALVTWIGERTRVMRKARVSIESGAVAASLLHHVGFQARDKGDLNETAVVQQLRKAGGADYNGGRG